jgi:16S rRNA (guanine1516-N2)-methyltransferase
MNITLYQNSTSNRLELIVQDMENNQGKSRFSVEFVKGPLGYRRLKGGGKQEAIAKAVGLNHYQNPITVLDATAGFGKDGFILASLGCAVHLVEQSPIVAALLMDGLKRAAQDPVIGPWVRLITVSVADAGDILNALNPQDYPMVIYLDPLFPPSKKSASSSLQMRILRALVHDMPAQDPKALLQIARLKAQKRVVVKRPKTAAPLGDELPHFCIASRSHRFDVYLPSFQRISHSQNWGAAAQKDR